MQPSLTTPTWVIVLAALTVLYNLLPWRTQPISPATLVYSWQDAPIPALFSPLIIPNWFAAVARVLQVLWIGTQPPSSRLTPIYLTTSYAVLLLTRSGLGFLLSRSVGWKYPRLFCHTALYEPVSGIGPLLLGALLFDGAGGKQQLLGRLAMIAAFVALDESPWSYLCGAAIAGIYRLAQAFTETGLKGYGLLPWHASSPDPQNGGTTYRDVSYLPKTRIFLLSIFAIALSAVFGNLHSVFSIYFPPLPPAPSDLHIVMLTVPRRRDLTSDVMIESIMSYVEPWPGGTNSTLTVYAHLGTDGKHPAFDRANSFFQGVDAPLTFYVEPSVGRPVMSHHAHLADAMRYAYRAGYRWTMFVEDDFVLCGKWGWDNLMRVMARLNEETSNKKFVGGFVGTGGSGVIFHRSLLPLIERLLTMEFSLDSHAAMHVHMPPDVLLQRCLSGEISFCLDNGWVISSRMLMGHRGGALSTGNRTYEDGKWACGWRHPQHGQKGADVVVV